MKSYAASILTTFGCFMCGQGTGVIADPAPGCDHARAALHSEGTNHDTLRTAGPEAEITVDALRGDASAISVAGIRLVHAGCLDEAESLAKIVAARYNSVTMARYLGDFYSILSDPGRAKRMIGAEHLARIPRTSVEAAANRGYLWYSVAERLGDQESNDRRAVTAEKLTMANREAGEAEVERIVTEIRSIEAASR